MVCIAFPAFFIASNVSLLMFADSMEYISRSRVMIWADVCSRDCSKTFFRRSAAFAANVRQYKCSRSGLP